MDENNYEIPATFNTQVLGNGYTLFYTMSVLHILSYLNLHKNTQEMCVFLNFVNEIIELERNYDLPIQQEEQNLNIRLHS